jgi:phage antirepressor YoqD-like protein
MAKTEVLFTFDQAARTMGITPERLERLIEEGKVLAVRESARTFIPREEILRYLSEVSAISFKDRK